ncbi:SH3 domain-containing protein [Streptomyces sp. NPDC005547]|uniref:SH3 domain-containing protein n=1 Tax=Streptomyces sp. NPDC005547 TaxID=3154887 RepID=UPI0033BB08C7
MTPYVLVLSYPTRTSEEDAHVTSLHHPPQHVEAPPAPHGCGVRRSVAAGDQRHHAGDRPERFGDGKSACTVTYDLPGYTTSGSVNLRTSPTTNSTSKGLLSKGTGFDAICGKGDWVYTYIQSGAHKHTYGWIYGSYVRIGG